MNTRQTHDSQPLPVRVYEGDGRIMVAAPMPGLEPQDISVTLSGDKVTIHGALRGPHQDERDLSLAEWAIGPYHRDLTLDHTVDGTRANATYGNGVLVLVLPKAEPRDGARTPRTKGTTRFTLDVLTATRGTHVGHAGRDLHRTTTGAQRRKQQDVADQAGKARHAVATKATKTTKATKATRTAR